MDDILGGIGFVALMLCVLMVSHCTLQVNEQDNAAITKMVSGGADPIKAKCAVRPSSPATADCVLAAGRP